MLQPQVRKRDAGFPVSTGEDYDYLQPASIVHVDFTLKSTLEASRDILKVNSDGYKRILCLK
jgi:hypothetical protein